MNYEFVPHLPDLIKETDYASDPAGKRVRLQLKVTENGIEILGDSVCPETLEKLLEQLGSDTIEQMLCG